MLIRPCLLILLLQCVAAVGQEAVYPGEEWQSAAPEQVEMDAALVRQARDYALSTGGSGMIIREGYQVALWGDPQQKYDLKSTSKSVGITALGLALADGKLNLSDRAVQFHDSFGVPPEENRATGWVDEITILHLATQTAGFEKPGGYHPLLFRPGTAWLYSDGGPNWLAECLTLVYGRDCESLLFDRVFRPIGITRDDLHWRKNAYRAAEIHGLKRCEFGSGVHANADALARIGYLYLRNGRWKEKQLLPQGFSQLVSQTHQSVAELPEHADAHDDASRHYGLLWWNNNDGSLSDVPRDAYWSWGLHDSLIVVIPSLKIVAVRTGKSWPRADGARHYDVLEPFIGAIARSAIAPEEEPRGEPGESGERAAKQRPRRFLPPYPPSRLIADVQWAPPESIVRRAEGSDNWPLTWGDDDAFYTAYGDGWGFEPRVPSKLSMGFARVSGPAHNPHGANIRTASGETTGQGAHGPKASGILMVDGILFLWVRNTDNSQLAFSEDRGATWRWCDWRFEQGFGCPTFLNFGKNYADSRDSYVYIYSPDSETAYDAADRLVLARVGKDRITDRASYAFYSGLDDRGQPQWSTAQKDCAPVFDHPGRCYRTHVNYHPQLKRYLMCQILPDSKHPQGPRFQGGFGIYDAPEPWGPWTTVFFTPAWDVGPGESSSLPARWASDDGRTAHLVFSGDDSFSVRRVRFSIR